MILAVSSSLESLLAVLLGLHQLRDQVVAGALPPQLEHLLEIHRRHRVAGVALLDLVRRQRHRIEQAPAIARTCIKYLAMLLGNSEHVADDGDRQAEREILDQVHPALRDDAVERFVDDLLDARAHVLDPAGGEGLHHQPAQAGVIRRILLQHPVAHAAEYRLVHDLGAVAADRALDIVLAEPLVAHHEADLGVAAADIDAERRQVHRIGGPHPLVMRIGIANEIGGQRVEQRRASGSLNMLVHGDLNWLLAARSTARSPPGRSVETRYIIVLSCILA